MSGYVVEPAGRQDALLGAPLEARVADLIRALDEPFELNDPDHLDACHRLWEATWPGVAFGGVDHKGWTRLGFRTGDLAAELQSGGIASVHHLLKLATYSPTLFASALDSPGDATDCPDCPLAPASLAVAFLLRGFLRLHAPGTVPQPMGGGGRSASDETLRRFLAWDESRPDAFASLHLEFTVYLLWGDTALHGRHAKTTLMQFSKALVQTRERIECMLPRIQAGDTYQVRAVAT
jgi:hypothetical protein